ncbi:Cysteine-rich RLK (receptor-like protein kinase) 8 [Dorcoceras hygrometricum]|uniref:Cysteine-rich RLK (Receptor-like protein kinase) 8 n=1 Tax=Dorcoceras hygrometricum TaxID=472368 RepID=A0A2Z6ZVK7_9LAMI|nr:Cysteine-rich RLK (receptor-like protein kinase) 8 [Dorcoceras hygrometricum]
MEMDVDGSCSIQMDQPSTGTETCADFKSKTAKRKSTRPRSEGDADDNSGDEEKPTGIKN